jgi:hypothetical protein
MDDNWGTPHLWKPSCGDIEAAYDQLAKGPYGVQVKQSNGLKVQISIAYKGYIMFIDMLFDILGITLMDMFYVIIHVD